MLIFVFFALVLAGAVLIYVAYPHRGAEVPRAPWIGEAMRKGVDALPTIDNERERSER